MLHSKNFPQGELENVLKAKLIYCLKIELQNDYKVTNYWLTKMTNYWLTKMTNY